MHAFLCKSIIQNKIHMSSAYQMSARWNTTLPYLNVSNARSKGRLRQIAHKPQDCHPHSHCSLHSIRSDTQLYWMLQKKSCIS